MINIADVIKNELARYTVNTLLEIGSATTDSISAVKRYNVDHESFAFSGFNLEDTSIDAIICRKSLCKIEKPMFFFGESSRVLRKGGILILTDYITDIDDSFLNVLLYDHDKSHIRAYTLPEIIDFSKNSFRLTDYRQFPVTIDFKDWAGKNAELLEKEINSFPLPICNELAVESKGGHIFTFTLKKGFFAFKKL